MYVHDQRIYVDLRDNACALHCNCTTYTARRGAVITWSVLGARPRSSGQSSLGNEIRFNIDYSKSASTDHELWQGTIFLNGIIIMPLSFFSYSNWWAFTWWSQASPSVVALHDYLWLYTCRVADTPLSAHMLWSFYSISFPFTLSMKCYLSRLLLTVSQKRHFGLGMWICWTGAVEWTGLLSRCLQWCLSVATGIAGTIGWPWNQWSISQLNSPPWCIEEDNCFTYCSHHAAGSTLMPQKPNNFWSNTYSCKG